MQPNPPGSAFLPSKKNQMETKNKTKLKIISMTALMLMVFSWSNDAFAIRFDNCRNQILQRSYDKEFQESLSVDDSLKVGLQKAQNLAQQGKVAEASKTYTNLMDAYPDNKEVVQGWLMLNMKRSPTGEEEAIQTLTDLSKIHPKNSAIIFWRMFLEAEYGQQEAALKDIDHLLKLQPDSAVYWVAKGQVCAEMKQYEEAATAFNRATTLDPKRGDVWGMKAGVLSKLGQYD